MENTIHVSNLSYSTTDESLSNEFSKYGTVVSSDVVNDRNTDESKGYGFIRMSTGDEATNALNILDGIEFEGSKIKLTKAKS